MKVMNSAAELRGDLDGRRRSGQRVALVPTMGALHQGHLSLVSLARQHADCIVMSVFVNPTQFNSLRDLEVYPRELEEDAAKAAGAGVDLLFAPSEDEMYPSAAGARTSVRAGRVAGGLCGAARPGHFDGVVTVVAMLFNIVGPDIAVFGEKDYQQLKVIEALVRDLHYPVTIVAAPLVRECDGLAMSSRNTLLGAEERRRALALSRSLFAARDSVRGGQRDASAVAGGVRAMLEDECLRVDYVQVVHPETLEPLNVIEGEAQLMAAVFAGEVRLIDNVRLPGPC